MGRIFFIRSTAARTIAAKIQYLNKDVKTAAQETIDEIEKWVVMVVLIALDKTEISLCLLTLLECTEVPLQKMEK